MKYILSVLSLLALIVTPHAFGASYSINTNAKGEGVLNRAIAAGGTHAGETKLSVVQKSVNAFLTNLFDQQTSGDSREIDEKIKVASDVSKAAAIADINAGISVPTVTNIVNQTHNVAQSPTISITATDPDGLALKIVGLNLPPGMKITHDAITGAPQITGTLTTAGTYAVEIRAYKFSDIFGSDTYSWVVNP